MAEPGALGLLHTLSHAVGSKTTLPLKAPPLARVHVERAQGEGQSSRQAAVWLRGDVEPGHLS